jgi:hypothetical protein
VGSKLKPFPIRNFEEFCRETKRRWRGDAVEGPWSEEKARPVYGLLVAKGELGWGSNLHDWDFQMYAYVGGEQDAI